MAIVDQLRAHIAEAALAIVLLSVKACAILPLVLATGSVLVVGLRVAHSIVACNASAIYLRHREVVSWITALSFVLAVLLLGLLLLHPEEVGQLCLQIVWVTGVENRHLEGLAAVDELRPDNAQSRLLALSLDLPIQVKLPLLLALLLLLRLFVHRRGHQLRTCSLLRSLSCRSSRRLLVLQLHLLLNLRLLLLAVLRCNLEQFAAQWLASFLLQHPRLLLRLLFILVESEVQLDVEAGEHGGAILVAHCDLEMASDAFGQVLAEDYEVELFELNRGVGLWVSVAPA